MATGFPPRCAGRAFSGQYGLSTTEDPKSGRPRPKQIGALRGLVPFARPYAWQILVALIALIGAAGTTLAIGQAVRRMVDNGFGSAEGVLLDQYFVALFGVFALLAVFTFARYYTVTWLGERIVADIRDRVYRNVITLDRTFYEQTKTGEVMPASFGLVTTSITRPPANISRLRSAMDALDPTTV